MRTALVNRLTKLAEKDKRIWLLTADLGFSVFENFRKKFPDRFINCGVAEQNMIGVAAGLALSGKKPYVYSIVPFVTMRCMEQIKNDIAYQKLDVKIIGAGGGFSYGSLGATHHAIEDLGILRVIPNLTVLAPGDPIESEQLTIKSYLTKNPTYIRLINNKDIIHKSSDKIEIGKPFVLKRGKHGVLIVNGIFLKIGIILDRKLRKMGYNFKMISLPTLKPIDKDALFKEVKNQKLVITLEEHNVIGGLNSILSEILMERRWKGKLRKVAVPDEYFSKVGNAEYIREKYHFNPDQLINFILKTHEK